MVLFDNLVTGFTPRRSYYRCCPRIRHHVNRDIWKEARLTALLSVPELFIANVALHWGTGRFGMRSSGRPYRSSSL